MRTHLLAVLYVIFTNVLAGQAIYIRSSDNAMFRHNIDDCTASFVAQVSQQLHDISFHQDGSIYGISSDGSIYWIDTLYSHMTLVELQSISGIKITDITSTPSLCGEQTGTIKIETTSGTSPLEFTMEKGTAQWDNIFTGLTAGTYHFVVRDSTGCSTDTTIRVTQTGCPIYIPNIFSPNNDGINDLFQIQTGDAIDVLITRFFIFDRWGNNVYQRYNLPIHSSEGWWDGTYKRFTCNAGVYSYFIEAEFENGVRETFKDNVTLIR